MGYLRKEEIVRYKNNATQGQMGTLLCVICASSHQIVHILRVSNRQECMDFAASSWPYTLLTSSPRSGCVYLQLDLQSAGCGLQSCVCVQGSIRYALHSSLYAIDLEQKGQLKMYTLQSICAVRTIYMYNGTSHNRLSEKWTTLSSYIIHKNSKG